MYFRNFEVEVIDGRAGFAAKKAYPVLVFNPPIETTPILLPNDDGALDWVPLASVKFKALK